MRRFAVGSVGRMSKKPQGSADSTLRYRWRASQNV
jgi:hypothetical protein